MAVLDAGGHLIALQRQDGAPTLRPGVATGKAAGALALGVASRKVAEMAAGGVIVVDTDGLAIGAVGATGDTSDNDEACVLAGCAAAGLEVQP